MSADNERFALFVLRLHREFPEWPAATCEHVARRIIATAETEAFQLEVEDDLARLPIYTGAAA